MDLNPHSIVIPERQRQGDLNITPEFIASIKKKIIHPIVVRQENDNIILVVGERRLTAMKAADINPLVEGEHFRFFNDLEPLDANIVELEENVKREELGWRDRVRAYGTLHSLLIEKNGKSWTTAKSAEQINISPQTLTVHLVVSKNLNNPALNDAGSMYQAYGILQSIAERKAVVAVKNITELATKFFAATEPNNVPPNVEANGSLPGPNSDSNSDIPPSKPVYSVPTVPSVLPYSIDAIETIDFREWIKTYEGEKFTFIHCDFPYDVQYQNYAHSVTSSKEDYNHAGFFPLLGILLSNLDKIASYSSHIMVWFGMEFYQKTKTILEEAGLFVHAHPFVWLKSDNAGIIPGRDNIYPRRIYETAFLCTKGRRPLISSKANAYAAPTPSSPIHSSQKSIPVLHHFFSMLIDETTTVLDPTAGSGSAIIAAEDMKAARVVGLEIDKSYCEAANAAVNRARKLRGFSQ